MYMFVMTLYCIQSIELLEGYWMARCMHMHAVVLYCTQNMWLLDGYMYVHVCSGPLLYIKHRANEAPSSGRDASLVFKDLIFNTQALG